MNASSQATLFAIARPTSGSAGGTHRILGRTVNNNDYELGLSRQDDNPGKLAAWSGKSGVLAQRAYDDQVTAAGTVVAMAGVWKNRSLSFYRDGERIASTAIGGTVAGATTNLKGWTLGGIEWNGTATWFANVDVAEFLLFDRALSNDELNDLIAWANGTYAPRGGNNMRQVAAYSYPPNCDCAGPAVETRPVDDDPNHDRVTHFAYDFRNRLTDIAGEEKFYERRTYDNLDRVVQVDRFDGPPNHPTTPTNFTARGTTHFDSQGNVYKRERFGVSSGTVQTNKLTENNWYDAARNQVTQSPMGAKDGRAFTKAAFDGDGQRTASYSGYYTGTMPEAYADALVITGSNKIFEQTLTTFDAGGNAIAAAFGQLNRTGLILDRRVDQA